MTLINCPKCQHTVSSVASRCPNCGALMTQYRFVQGQGGTLTECRRCSRKVLSGATTCPYCGVSHPGRHVPLVLAVLVAALAVPVLLFVTLYSRAPSPRSLAVESPATQPAKGGGPDARGTRSEATGARDVGRTVPARSAAQSEPVAEGTPTTSLEAEGSRNSDSVVTPPAGSVAKWTLDWANVREGRALGTPVIHVLHPGEQVLVGDRQAGWWAVYRESKVFGYVAGSVLSDQPPRPEPPPDSTRASGR
jgi:RNA polymerase subunit RPABC4/transcription elongation factor Spt4